MTNLSTEARREAAHRLREERDRAAIDMKLATANAEYLRGVAADFKNQLDIKKRHEQDLHRIQQALRSKLAKYRTQLDNFLQLEQQGLLVDVSLLLAERRFFVNERIELYKKVYGKLFTQLPPIKPLWNSVDDETMPSESDVNTRSSNISSGDTFQRERSAFQKRIAMMQTTVNSVSCRVRRYRTLHRRVKERVESHEKVHMESNDTSQSEENPKESKLRELVFLYDDLKSQNDYLTIQLAASVEDANSLRETGESLNETIDLLQNQLAAQSDQIAQLEEDVRLCNRELTHKEEEIKDKIAVIVSLDTKVEILKSPKLVNTGGLAVLQSHFSQHPLDEVQFDALPTIFSDDKDSRPYRCNVRILEAIQTFLNMTLTSMYDMTRVLPHSGQKYLDVIIQKTREFSRSVPSSLFDLVQATSQYTREFHSPRQKIETETSPPQRPAARSASNNRQRKISRPTPTPSPRKPSLPAVQRKPVDEAPLNTTTEVMSKGLARTDSKPASRTVVTKSESIGLFSKSSDTIRSESEDERQYEDDDQHYEDSPRQQQDSDTIQLSDSDAAFPEESAKTLEPFLSSSKIEQTFPSSRRSTRTRATSRHRLQSSTSIRRSPSRHGESYEDTLRRASRQSSYKGTVIMESSKSNTPHRHQKSPSRASSIPLMRRDSEADSLRLDFFPSSDVPKFLKVRSFFKDELQNSEASLEGSISESEREVVLERGDRDAVREALISIKSDPFQDDSFKGAGKTFQNTIPFLEAIRKFSRSAPVADSPQELLTSSDLQQSETLSLSKDELKSVIWAIEQQESQSGISVGTQVTSQEPSGPKTPKAPLEYQSQVLTTSRHVPVPLSDVSLQVKPSTLDFSDQVGATSDELIAEEAERVAELSAFKKKFLSICTRRASLDYATRCMSLEDDRSALVDVVRKRHHSGESFNSTKDQTAFNPLTESNLVSETTAVIQRTQQLELDKETFSTWKSLADCNEQDNTGGTQTAYLAEVRSTLINKYGITSSPESVVSQVFWNAAGTGAITATSTVDDAHEVVRQEVKLPSSTSRELVQRLVSEKQRRELESRVANVFWKAVQDGDITQTTNADDTTAILIHSMNGSEQSLDQNFVSKLLQRRKEVEDDMKLPNKILTQIAKIFISNSEASTDQLSAISSSECQISNRAASIAITRLYQVRNIIPPAASAQEWIAKAVRWMQRNPIGAADIPTPDILTTPPCDPLRVPLTESTSDSHTVRDVSNIFWSTITEDNHSLTEDHLITEEVVRKAQSKNIPLTKSDLVAITSKLLATRRRIAATQRQPRPSREANLLQKISKVCCSIPDDCTESDLTTRIASEFEGSGEHVPQKLIERLLEARKILINSDRAKQLSEWANSIVPVEVAEKKISQLESENQMTRQKMNSAIAIYTSDISSLSGQLSTTNQKLTELQSIVSTLETETFDQGIKISNLAADLDLAEKELAHCEQKLSTMKTAYEAEVQKVAEKTNLIDRHFKERGQLVCTLEMQVAALKEELDNQQASHDMSCRKINKSHQRELLTEISKTKKIEDQHKKLRQVKDESLSEMRTDLEKELDKATQKLARQHRRDIQELKLSWEKSEKEHIKTLSNAIHEQSVLKVSMDSLKEDMKDSTNQRDYITRQYERAREQVSQLHSDLKLTKSSFEETIKRLEREKLLEKESDRIKILEMTRLDASKSSEMSTLERQLSETESTLNTQQDQISNLLSDNKRLNDELSSIRNDQQSSLNRQENIEKRLRLQNVVSAANQKLKDAATRLKQAKEENKTLSETQNTIKRNEQLESLSQQVWTSEGLLVGSGVLKVHDELFCFIRNLRDDTGLNVYLSECGEVTELRHFVKSGSAGGPISSYELTLMRAVLSYDVRLLVSAAAQASKKQQKRKQASEERAKDLIKTWMATRSVEQKPVSKLPSIQEPVHPEGSQAVGDVINLTFTRPSLSQEGTQPVARSDLLKRKQREHVALRHSHTDTVKGKNIDFELISNNVKGLKAAPISPLCGVRAKSAVDSNPKGVSEDGEGPLEKHQIGPSSPKHWPWESNNPDGGIPIISRLCPIEEFLNTDLRDDTNSQLSSRSGRSASSHTSEGLVLMVAGSGVKGVGNNNPFDAR